MKKQIKKRLVVVSNRLPFSKITNKKGDQIWEKSVGGLITAMDPILRSTQGMWVGWDGDLKSSNNCELKVYESSDIAPEDDDRKGSYSLAVVPLLKKEYEEYYIKFSNGTLWALFHYFFEKSTINYSDWKIYKQVNKKFASYINDIAGPDDIIWVQDFHLFLVPYYLRKLRPNAEIHFFLHIPFPHLDIFSILPWQREILESLLCCNTVGFHEKQYLKNYEGCVDVYKREKKLAGNKTVEENTITHGYANPISIDFDTIDKMSRKKSVLKRKKEIIERAGCSKILIGVDRIDYSKGIKERMLGLETLFEEHPELQGKIFYYQLVVPSRESLEAYSELKKEIDEIIGRINGKFSKGFWTPINYNYGTVSFEELVALYSAADIALVTPLRDGMNLVCKEYIAAHSDEDGVLVLSKFAGAISEIKNCITINPYNTDDIAEAIYTAIQMPQKERKRRMIKMRKNIQANTINIWLEKCLKEFEIAKKGKNEKVIG
ncbi:MAG: trehalose-6-phosphate synthase [Candidatus Omnitrophica bacterium]|nr:trehalose-6-phosphate synthase [Candidatus Omnitrophota bacterium]